MLPVIRYFFYLLLLTYSLDSLAAKDRALFWEVTTEKSTVYLFGSIHLANASFYPLRSQVYQAFDQATHLVVEADISDHSTMLDIQQWLTQHGYYPPGQTIQQDLSTKTYQHLRRFIIEQGLDPAIFEQQKPGLVITTLTSLSLVNLGFSSALGIDMHFLARAKQQQKPILALETLQQQLSLLINLSEPDFFVRQSLSQMHTLQTYMSEIITAWKQGDEKEIATLLLTDDFSTAPEYRTFYDQLFTQRNRAMANQISRYLQQPGRYFVVVGAGHLVGPDSIIALLQEQNLSVRRR